MIDKNDPRLTAFVLGELEESDRQEIQAAIDAQSELQAEIKQIQKASGQLESFFQTESGVGLTNEQLDLLKAELNEDSKVQLADQNQIDRPNRRTGARLFWGATASILGLFLIGLLWWEPLIEKFANVYSDSNPTQLSAPKESGRDAPLVAAAGGSPPPTSVESDPEFQRIKSLVDSEQWKKDLESADNPEEATRILEERLTQIENEIIDPSGNVSSSREAMQQILLDEKTKIQEMWFESKLEPELVRLESELAVGDSPQDSLDNLLPKSSLNFAEFDQSKFDGQVPQHGGFDLRGRIDLNGRLELNESEPNLVDSDVFVTESFATHDRRTEEQKFQVQERYPRPAEFLSGGEIPLAVALAGRQKGKDAPPAPPGYRYETRTRDVPFTRMLQQTKTRSVPIQKTRIETRTRITSDGKEEEYQVSVPYTEQVAQSYTVNVPVQEMVTQNYQVLVPIDRSADAKQLTGAVAKQNANSGEKKTDKPKSWRRVKATSNTSRLMVGDKDELDMQAMQVNVQVDGFQARVLIDCFYYNDRDRQLEGTFKIRLPDDSSLYYFAFGQSAYDFAPEQPIAGEEFLGKNYQFVSLRPADIRRDRQEAWNNVKESRMVPKEKAAFAYSQTVRRRVDPALVEWSGAGVFNARVFPLMPKKLHRIVIGYDVSLTQTADGWAYQLDLPEQTGNCHVDLNVTDVTGSDWQLAFDENADEEDSKSIPAIKWQSGENGGNGRSSKRHRFSDPQWRSMRLSSTGNKALVVRSEKDESMPFFATRFKVDLPADKNNDAAKRALFLVDTSLSSRPDKFNVWLDLLKATLNNNRDQVKEFAVMFFSVDSQYWKTEYVENTEANTKQLLKDCYQLELEGATDLHGAMRTVAETQWLTEGGKPDLFLLSDGAANWGETNLHLIHNEIVAADVGSLFAFQTGLNGTAISNLRFLAGRTGGAVFSVASEDEIAKASTAFRSRPWKLESIEIDGASDVMTAGRVQWVYPDQPLTIVGRGVTKSDVELRLTRGDESKTLTVSSDVQIESETAGRLYGQVAVGQLERLGDQVFDVAAAYARHFRITGSTCSLLMLETEADYQRFNIKLEEDNFVVKSRNANSVVEKTLAKHAESIADPKTQLIKWVQRLEAMPQLRFKMPTAIKIALDDLNVVAVDGRLKASESNSADWSKKYASGLAETLDYDVVATEAERRKSQSVDAALKAYSNLIEKNPGDFVIAKDVAYTAMELDRPAPAYHLLRRAIQSRPFDSSSYSAIGQCLAQLGQADMAMVYYEIALAGTFPNQGADFRQIAATEYMSMLRNVVAGKIKTEAKNFAEARLESLSKTMNSESDLIITMMWNTDSTDVDLHVTEPTGETCSYQNKKTKSGGRITADITNGFGPEMYTTKNAIDGTYRISAKYFGNNQNRTKVPTKIQLTVYRNFGSADEAVSRETIRLSTVGEVEEISSVGIGIGIGSSKKGTSK